MGTIKLRIQSFHSITFMCGEWINEYKRKLWDSKKWNDRYSQIDYS